MYSLNFFLHIVKFSLISPVDDNQEIIKDLDVGVGGDKDCDGNDEDPND